MTTLQEALDTNSGATLKAMLDGAIDTISAGQTVTFQKYNRVVIPADGFVFWVIDTTTPPMTLQGSLHHVLNKQQDAEQSFGRNNIVFTSKTDASQAFNALGSTSIYIGYVDDVDTGVQFAFSRLGFYANAGVFHYSGVAIMPHMQSQIIANPSTFDAEAVIVSNSLPFFLTLNNYTPFYGFGNSIPLFPSHITTPNFTPPYGSIEISDTRYMSDAPWMDRQSSRWQLCRDRVSIVLNGVRHADAMTFVDCLYQYSRDYNTIGFIDGPSIRDEKIAQSELFMIAMRKRIEVEVTYQQTTARDIARQLIQTAVPAIQQSAPIGPMPPFTQGFFGTVIQQPSSGAITRIVNGPVARTNANDYLVLLPPNVTSVVLEQTPETGTTHVLKSMGFVSNATVVIEGSGGDVIDGKPTLEFTFEGQAASLTYVGPGVGWVIY